MLIDKKIQTEKGVTHFKGEVDDQQLDMIIELGLQVLYEMGLDFGEALKGDAT